MAPLYVFFDATGSTATGIARPQSELLYEWDFADSGSGNWATDGKSRDTAKGPVTAHVFETPGTYVVSLIASDGLGGVDSKTVSIVVSDPNTVFSGTNTICFSTTSDFTGAPTGSQHVTTTNLATIQTYIATGKRLLLHRGQTWNAPSTLEISPAGPGTIGAFGTGAAPILVVTAATYVIVPDSSCSDWRVMDLEINGASYAGDTRGCNGSGSQMLFLRLNIHDIHCGIYENGDQIGIVDSTLTHLVNGGGGNMAFLTVSQLGILGCTMWDSTGAEHIIRTPSLIRGVIGHNVLGMQAATKHVLKIHAAGGTTYSEKIVISDNTLTGNSDWTVALAPQNASVDERVRDVIVERNFFKNVSGQQQEAVEICAQEITVRNNIFNLTAANGRTAVEIAQRGIEPAPANNRIFNNTVYASDGVVTLANIASVASYSTVRNDLVTNPTGTPIVVSGGGSNLTSDHNLATNTPGFVVGSPVNAADFALAAGSAAVNYGTPVAVYEDYTGADRPVGAYDAGAYEYGAGSNHAPVANNDSYSTYKNTALNQSAPGVLANDTDADNDTLTAVKVTDVSHGTLTLNSNGSFLYTPTAGYSGSDSFTYQAYDGKAYSNTATVSLTITNRAPVAANDSYSTYKNTALNQSAPGVLANDTDADGDTLTAVKVANVSHGTLTLNSNGSFLYTPTAGWSGSDSFTYQAYDGTAYSNTATVSLTVTNRAPVATADSYSTPMNTPLNQSAPGVLANDTDADGDTLTAVKVTDVSHGTLTLNSNGSFTYTPTTGYTGSDSFTYHAYDGTAYSNTVTVTLTVTASAPTRATFTSVGAEDGYIWESAQGSGVGGGCSADETSSWALRLGDTASNQQSKVILSFDTSTIPAGATITSATLYLVGANRDGTSPWTWGGTCYVDIKGGSGFNGSTTLENADFQAAADATRVATMTPSLSGGSISKGGFTSGLSFINKTGRTQLRVYMSTATNANGVEDLACFYSGENSTPSYRPVLAVQYQ